MVRLFNYNDSCNKDNNDEKNNPKKISDNNVNRNGENIYYNDSFCKDCNVQRINPKKTSINNIFASKLKSSYVNFEENSKENKNNKNKEKNNYLSESTKENNPWGDKKK